MVTSTTSLPSNSYSAFSHSTVMTPVSKKKSDLDPFECVEVGLQQNDIALLKRGLNEGASPSVFSDILSSTPLEYACKKGYLHLAAVLVSHGAKPMDKALKLASEGRHYDCADLLIKNKASVDYVDLTGVTQLDHACHSFDITNLLIQAKANIDQGYPLHNAILKGNINVVALLISHKANIEKQLEGDQYTGFRPLHVAAKKADEVSVKLLLKNKANPHALTKEGETPLKIAAKLYICQKYLIEKEHRNKSATKPSLDACELVLARLAFS